MKKKHETNHLWIEKLHERLVMNMNALRNQPEQAGAPAQNSHPPVNFYCAAPHARSVALAGDFNRWQPLSMRRLVDGWWFARVKLCPGSHQYRFLVDEKPMLDPHATGFVRDENDEPVSLLAVS